MKKFITLIFALAVALPGMSQSLKQSGWTTTTDPAVARAALGVNTNGDVLVNANAITNNNASEVNLQNDLHVLPFVSDRTESFGIRFPTYGPSVFVWRADLNFTSGSNSVYRFWDRPQTNNFVSFTPEGVYAQHFIGSGVLTTNVPIANYEWMQKLMPTPLLAWDSWYEWTSGPAFNESNILAKAQLMLTNGMYAAGYRMMRISDPWALTARDANGDMQWDTTRFPSGSNIVSQLHALGYTVGLYSSYHPTITTTCEGAAGSTRETIYADMKKFAAWGVDHVFMDACGAFGGVSDDLDYVREYCRIVPNAVAESGKPMTLTMVIARNAPAEAATACNILPLPGSWDYGFASSVRGQSAGEYCYTPQMSMTNARAVIARPEFYGPGHYVYWSTINFQQTDAQTKFNMSIAALLGSPLTVGVPITSTALGYMTNTEVLAINQDATLRPVRVASSNALAEVWYRPIGGNADTNAVALINMSNATQTVTCTFTNLGLPAGTILSVRDVWGSELGIFTNSFSQSITATNIGLYRLSPVATELSTWIARFKSPAAIYGSGGATLGIQTNVGPALDVFGNAIRILSPSANGVAVYDNIGFSKYFEATQTGATVPNYLRMIAPSIPANASATGLPGQLSWDGSFFYVCTATNTWKRVAISTW